MKEIIYEYGVMSSRFRLTASNKLTAYATMILHLADTPHLIAIYLPEESNKDSWLTTNGDCHAKIDDLFGGEHEFEKYLEKNQLEIKDCYKSIKKLT